MKSKQQLVNLWRRPNRDGTSYTYYLNYTNLEGKRIRKSLRHRDERKAQRQRLKKEKELKMGFCPPTSMRLSEFIEDSLRRSGEQIRESTKTEYRQMIEHFIRVVGDIDYQTVTESHGERFRQACLDEGNTKDTVAKKIRQLKAIFKLASERNQFEISPLKNLKPPRTPTTRKIFTYSEDQCDRLVREATIFQREQVLEWDLMITLALTTAMRKSELLNMIWSDIDFKNMTIEITPKDDTEYTWQWLIKDYDSRTLPLTEDVMNLLISLQERRPTGCPYVLIPPNRYKHIQTLRKQGKWDYESSRIKVINNFTRQFKQIRAKAGIKNGTFHDLRRTAITNWFYEGLEINEVMKISGHSKYETCLKYYLSVKDDLMSKARKAVKYRVNREMLEKCLGE